MKLTATLVQMTHQGGGSPGVMVSFAVKNGGNFNTLVTAEESKQFTLGQDYSIDIQPV